MNKTAAQIADTVLEKLAADFSRTNSMANKAFGELDRATARPTQAPKPAAVAKPMKAPAPAQVTKPVKAPAPVPTAMKPAPQVKTPPVMKPQAPTQVQKPVQKPAVMKPTAAPAPRVSKTVDAFSRLDANVKKYPGGAIISRRTIGKPPTQ